MVCPLVSKFILSWLLETKRHDELEEKGNNLYTTDYREPCQKSHGASNQADLGIKLDLLVSLYVVECCRVEIDLDKLNCGVLNFVP